MIVLNVAAPSPADRQILLLPSDNAAGRRRQRTHPVEGRHPPDDMLDRFYAPTSFNQPLIELPEDEAHHLSRVLRKRLGDRVCVFDGRGGSAEAEVETLDRRRVRLRIVEQQPTAGPTEPAIVLATAVPKGDRARWLVEKATELGIAAWVPLQTERGVVDPGAARLDKLRQTVIAACKQCGRNRLLEIAEPRSWPEFLAGRGGDDRLIVADPSGRNLEELQTPGAANTVRRILAAIGPEGGFTPEELEMAQAHGAEIVNLGRLVLRIETAGIVLATRLTPGLNEA